MSKEEEKIQRFVDLTESTNEVARKYLNQNSWQINYALNDYYDSELGGFVSTKQEQVKYPDELKTLFNNYSNDDNIINFEGMIKFIADLNLNLEDLVTICLAKLLGWERLTSPINEEQFLSNWFMQGCSQLSDMQAVIKDLEVRLFTDEDYFTDIYNYTFGLVLDTGKKTIDLETAIDYWRLFFSQDLDHKPVIKIDPELFSSWLTFLESENKQDITNDCWHMLIEYFKKFYDFAAIAKKYDENDAWPYLFDEFFEYLEDTKHI